MLSLAALIFAVAVLIGALRFDSSEALAVDAERQLLPTSGVIFTQSADGKALYQWEWSASKKSWVATKFPKK